MIRCNKSTVVVTVVYLLAAVMCGCGGKKGADKEAARRDAHNYLVESADESAEHSHEPHDAHNRDEEGHVHTEGEHAAGQQDDADVHSNDESDGEDPDVVVFTDAQASRTDFEVRTVQKGDFRSVIKAGGEISAAQNQVKVITSPISGVVTYMDARLTTNADVGSGQELFHISSASVASGDAVVKARINYNQAKAEYERVSKLYEDRIVSQSDYLAAEAAYLTAKAEFAPVSRYAEDGCIYLKSPSSGYVSQVNVSMGDYVEMGYPLATVAKRGRMQLQVHVSQRYLDELYSVTDANFRIPSSDIYYSVSGLNGKLNSVGKIVSKGSALIPVLFELDNNGRFIDGSVVEVSLLGAVRKNVVTVPVSAITEQEGLYYVYVRISPEHYKRREVKPGQNDGDNVEIVSGLRGGEDVVTRGAVNLKVAAYSGTIPHGHSH